jgi:hypothetical protein
VNASHLSSRALKLKLSRSAFKPLAKKASQRILADSVNLVIAQAPASKSSDLSSGQESEDYSFEDNVILEEEHERTRDGPAFP